jgi:hypothetical protein
MPPKKPRKTQRKRKGLTAKERSQVSKIAKGAISSVAEKKYMDSAQFTSINPVAATATNATVSCLCFSSTTNESPNGSVLTYGTLPIREQLCLRPFSVDRSNDTPGADTSNYIIGKECKPVSCRSQWRIQRQAASMDSITSLGSTNTPGGLIGVGPDQYPNGLAEACPIVCRMVRFVVKNLAGTDTEYNPSADLFLNMRGDAVGVSKSEFKQKEMLAYKVNNRRYTTLDDKVFTLQNPLTVQYTWAPKASSTSDEGWWVPQVSNGSANCEKYITLNQMLTQKRHGSVYYPEPITSTYDNATVGQRREFTAFHFYYKGADNLVGGATGGLKGPLDVTIDLVNTTKFIDV